MCLLSCCVVNLHLVFFVKKNALGLFLAVSVVYTCVCVCACFGKVVLLNYGYTVDS